MEWHRCRPQEAQPFLKVALRLLPLAPAEFESAHRQMMSSRVADSSNL